MQTKIKAIANKIIAQYNRTNLCASVECINQKINNTGKKLANLGVSANFVTITGFVLGMIAVNFLALENYFWAFWPKYLKPIECMGRVGITRNPDEFNPPPHQRATSFLGRARALK